MNVRRCAAAMLVSAASCAALANNDDAAETAPAPRTSIEVESLAPLNARLTPPASSLPASSGDWLLPPSDAADTLRARWWLRLGAVGIGTGSDWPSRGAMRQVFGLRADLSRQASVVYERVSPPSPVLGFEPGPPSERVALEFKSSDPASMYRGFVRLQISSTSSLQLRPRRGGMVVSWRASF